MKKRILTILLVLVVVVGAIFAVNATATVSLTGNVTGGKTITVDTELDLNGFDIDTLTVNEGVTVTIKDSATADYSAATAADYGQIGSITGGGTVAAADGYLMIGETADVSFHAYKLKVTSVSLRTEKIIENGASIYYTVEFAGDEVIKANIDSFGVALKAEGGEYFAEGLAGGKTYTEYTASQWTAGKVQEFNSCELSGIMKTKNSTATNAKNFDVSVYCAPYIKLDNGDKIMGTDAVRSLYDIIKTLDDSWINASATDPDTIGYTAKNALVSMQKTFKVFTRDEFSATLRKINQLFGDGQTFTIRSASDLQVATSNPAGTFTLGMLNDAKELDMSGVAWTPFTNFTGVFNGNGQTISNLTIDTQSDNAMGFFGTVAEGATVTNLHLRDVTVDASGTTANSVGTVAGVNNGTITGVTVTGTVTSTRDNAKVGALVGTSTGTVTPGTSITDTVSVYQLINNNGQPGYGINSTATEFSTEGLSAIVGLYTEGENVTTGLVADGAVTDAANVYWRDTSYSTKRQSKTLQDRRATVVAEMYNSGTYRWTPAQTFTHYTDTTVHQRTYSSETRYVGTPYDHRSTPYAMAMDFVLKTNSSGQWAYYTMDISDYTDVWTNNFDSDSADVSITDPYDGYTMYISSDCSSACIVAWQQVSPILLSTKTNGGVSFGYTTTMIPSQVNQYYYGVRPVGYTVDDKTMNNSMTYACNLTSYSSSIVDQDDTGIAEDSAGNDLYYNDEAYGDFYQQPQYAVNTLAIGSALYYEYGSQGIYEAYAQTRMGDVLINGGEGGYGGHARMAAQDPVVIRDGNDDINAKKSYFLIHEQGDGLYDFESTHSSWRINHQYTFAQLAFKLSGDDWGTYSGSKGVYLPITMDALNNESISAGAVASGATYAYAPEDTMINATSRILSATLIIKDSTGEEVYRKTYYQSAISGAYSSYGTSLDTNFARCVPGYVPFYSKYFVKEADYKADLDAGTYTYDYEVKTFSGKTTMLSSVVKEGYTDKDGNTTTYIFTVS